MQVGNEDHLITKSQGVSLVPTFRVYRNGSSVKDIDGYDYDLLENTIKSLNS